MNEAYVCRTCRRPLGSKEVSECGAQGGLDAELGCELLQMHVQYRIDDPNANVTIPKDKGHVCRIKLQ